MFMLQKFALQLFTFSRAWQGAIGAVEPCRVSFQHRLHAVTVLLRDPKIADGRIIILEEQILMVDLSRQLQPSPKCQVTFQNVKGSGVELDQPIFVGLCSILVPRDHARLGYFDLALAQVAVRDEQRALL